MARVTWRTTEDTENEELLIKSVNKFLVRLRRMIKDKEPVEDLIYEIDSEKLRLDNKVIEILRGGSITKGSS